MSWVLDCATFKVIKARARRGGNHGHDLMVAADPPRGGRFIPGGSEVG